MTYSTSVYDQYEGAQPIGDVRTTGKLNRHAAPDMAEQPSQIARNPRIADFAGYSNDTRTSAAGGSNSDHMIIC